MFWICRTVRTQTIAVPAFSILTPHSFYNHVSLTSHLIDVWSQDFLQRDGDHSGHWPRNPLRDRRVDHERVVLVVSIGPRAVSVQGLSQAHLRQEETPEHGVFDLVKDNYVWGWPLWPDAPLKRHHPVDDGIPGSDLAIQQLQVVQKGKPAVSHGSGGIDISAKMARLHA